VSKYFHTETYNPLKDLSVVVVTDSTHIIHRVSSNSSSEQHSLQCSPGFVIATTYNVTESDILCSGGRWIVSQTNVEVVASVCGPFCSSACLNGGRCVGPDLCSCTDDFSGDFCEQEACSVSAGESVSE